MASEISDAKPDRTAEGAHGRAGRDRDAGDEPPPVLVAGSGREVGASGGEGVSARGTEDGDVGESIDIDLNMDLDADAGGGGDNGERRAASDGPGNPPEQAVGGSGEGDGHGDEDGDSRGERTAESAGGAAGEKAGEKESSPGDEAPAARRARGPQGAAGEEREANKVSAERAGRRRKA